MLDEERGDRSINFGNDFADYTVYDIDYEKIGKVHDVFVDENDQTRYIGVKMGFLGTRTALIPVELARVNDKRWLVEVAAGKEAVKEGPTFSDDREITPEFERWVLNYYGVRITRARAGRETYEASYSDDISNERVNLWLGEPAGCPRAHFGEDYAGASRGRMRGRGSDDPNDENELMVQRVEEELRASTRERDAGSVRLRKRVRTDREQVLVPKKRQEVCVERAPVQEVMGAFEPEIVNDGDEIRVPVIEEEIVVERRPVVKEVLRLRKEVVEDEEVVEENIRKEEIDLDDRTERGASIRNDANGDGEIMRHLPQQTRNMTKSKEHPKTDGKPDRPKGASERAREDLPVRSYNDLTVAEAKKKLGGLPQSE